MKLFKKNIILKKTSPARREENIIEGEGAPLEADLLRDTAADSSDGSPASSEKVPTPEEKTVKKKRVLTIFSPGSKRRGDEDTPEDNKKKGKGFTLLSRGAKSEKKGSKKGRKGRKKGGDNRLVILLMPVLLILLGILLKDPAVNLYRELTRPEPAPAPAAPVKSGPALTTAYEEGEDLLSWNLTKDLLGAQTLEFLKGDTMNLWVEYNERGVLLYHELLNKEIPSKERDALLRFLPRLKVIHTREKEPLETLFLLKLRYDEGEEKLSPDFHFFSGKSQAVNFLMGRPLDYVEEDSRPANATQPVITGRISGIMIGNTASVLLDSGERIVVGDKVREGVVREILPRYILVEKNGKISKFYVGQSI